MSATVRTTYAEFEEMARRGDYDDIEVAHTTLSLDRGTKAKLYAQAGIADYWIVNLRKRCLEIRRDPQKGRCRTVQTLHPGDEARPLAFPQIALAVSQLFPD
jgi:Uma2 family endonuclease